MCFTCGRTQRIPATHHTHIEARIYSILAIKVICCCFMYMRVIKVKINASTVLTVFILDLKYTVFDMLTEFMQTTSNA